MKRLLWLSLIPLTMFWLFSVDIYGPVAGAAPAIISILLGITISILGFWGSKAQFDRQYAAVLVPLGGSCFVVPSPYNAGLIVTFIAILIALIAPRWRSIWLGALLAGVILTAHTLVLSIYYIVAPNYHEVGWLSPLVAILTDITGLQAASNDGLLLILAQKNVFPFTVTLEKLAFYPWILIFAGAVILIFITSNCNFCAAKRILGVILVSFIFVLFRFLALVLIFLSSDMPPQYAGARMDIFIDPPWIIVSFIPLVLLFLLVCPMDNQEFDFRLKIDKRLVVGLAAVGISAFCLTGAAIFQDPGVKKDGRVLVDEIHSIWEFSTLKLDKEWYGEYSTYNAYSMIEWLKDNYRVDRIVSHNYKDLNVSGATKVVPDIVSDNLTYDILKKYDILIIKTPTSYRPDEVDAIVRFVGNGGGLFLIGDHTNFAGTGTDLNQIATRFGIEFGSDSVNTMNNRLYQYKRGQLPHPVIKYMPRLDFMTGCSLRVPLSGEPVILGFGMSAEPGEYSSVGFFRETRTNDPTQATDTIWGLINQAVALKYGMGRVVAFPDSTVISNFRIFFGGSPNFIIGAMEYLNRKNSYPYAKQIFFIVGLITAVAAAYMLGRMGWGDKRLAVLVIVLALGTLSASGSMLLFSTKVEGSIPSQFYVKNHTIGFDGEHSDTIVSQGDKNGQYETFFVWTQRVNLTPSIEDSLVGAMTRARCVVIIDPIKPLTEVELSYISKYMENGNSVFLMMNSSGPWSYLAKYFGMETYQIEEPSNKTWSAKKGLPIEPWGLAIEGGRPLLTIDKRIVLAEANYGRGKLVLFTDSHVFKDGLYGNPGYMGYYKSDPDTVDKKRYDLRALYNLEYRVFEDYLGIRENRTDPIEPK